eukprot:1481163-Rhodomonas_salina.1
MGSTPTLNKALSKHRICPKCTAISERLNEDRYIGFKCFALRSTRENIAKAISQAAQTHPLLLTDRT